MENEVYKTIQITGTSTSSSDDAIRTALEKAAKTVHNMTPAVKLRMERSTLAGNN